MSEIVVSSGVEFQEPFVFDPTRFYPAGAAYRDYPTSQILS